jgi:hypothetical protein
LTIERMLSLTALISASLHKHQNIFDKLITIQND